LRLGVVTLLAVTSLFPGCLPKDTRDPPGKLQFVARGSEGVASGIAADRFVDGWSVTFDRFLVKLSGGFSENGGGRGPSGGDDDCVVYSDRPGSNRLLELGLPSGTAGDLHGARQQAGFVRGLGEKCRFGISLAPYRADDLVLGAGVSSSDVSTMEGSSSSDGALVYARGSGTKEGRTVRFSLLFTTPQSFHDCGTGSMGEGGTIRIDSNATVEALVTLHGERLFADELRPNTTLRFEPFADADARYGDGDGEVTMKELEKVPLADLVAAVGPGHYDIPAFVLQGGLDTTSLDAGAPDGGVAALNLGLFAGLTLQLMPEIGDGGGCAPDQFGRSRGGRDDD
jgi:hypothetical protein